jgi:hypothetical protein
MAINSYEVTIIQADNPGEMQNILNNYLNLGCELQFLIPVPGGPNNHYWAIFTK